MQVALFGKTVTFRWRTLIVFVIVVLFASIVALFSYYFIRSFIAIQKSGDSTAWLEQSLDSSVSRAIANSHPMPEDLQNLTRDGRPTLGPANAKLTVVAFLDYGCPFCRAADGPFRETMIKYQDRVRFVLRDFPIDELHPNATQAAVASRCAFAQGKGWAFHDLLFRQTGDLVPADFVKYATQAGADPIAFQACVNGNAYAEDIRQDQADGLRAGVDGTPTYFFNGVRIQGVNKSDPQAFFSYLIDRFLKDASTSSTKQ